MRRAGTILCGTMLSILAGCIGVRPARPIDASVEVPTAWRTTIAPQTASNDRWWESFGDAALNDLVARAIERNADLSEAASRVAEARAVAEGARALRFPALDLAASEGYSRTVTLGLPVTSLGGISDLAVAWDTDLFGRLASADLAARTLWMSSRAARDAIRLAIVSETTQTYIELLGADARLEILRATLESRAQSLKAARRLTENGYASQLEFREAEGEYESTAQLVPQVELEAATLENAISVLTGDTPRSIDRRASRLSALMTPGIPVELPSRLLRNRPDLIAAEDSVVAADHQLDSARAAMLPNVTLTGALGQVRASTLPSPLTIFSLGGSVLAPLFDAGRRKADADAKTAARDRAAYAYRAAVLKAFREVEDGLAAVSRLEAIRAASHREAAADAERLRIITRRREIGYASSIDHLDAQRRLLSAQVAAVRSDTASLINCVKLIKATGGGWSSSPRDSAVMTPALSKDLS